VEGLFRAGLGKPVSRVAGSGAMIHITAHMRVLVAIEPVDGRKGIDSLVRVCQGQLCEDPAEKRTGVFTSGIVSVGQERKIALYFTGSRHAGENLAEVLKKRRAELPSPIQMCDALSRNVPKLPAGMEILLARAKPGIL
jgi:hypothetical protein